MGVSASVRFGLDIENRILFEFDLLENARYPE